MAQTTTPGMLLRGTLLLDVVPRVVKTRLAFQLFLDTIYSVYGVLVPGPLVCDRVFFSCSEAVVRSQRNLSLVPHLLLFLKLMFPQSLCLSFCGF